jgi:Rrf2 family protein
MRFTQAASYGLSACSYLADAPADEVVPNMTICSALKMPDRFVSQVMRLLATADVVTSTRGRDGGYQLAKPASKISLLEIIEAVDGPIGANGPVALAGVSKVGQAMVEKAYAAAAADLRKRLASVTLADLRAAKAT